jgi:hypothetical protein
MKSILLSSALGIANAHVRGLFRDASVRSASTPQADGGLSVAGPCAGQNTFGRNGITEVFSGDAVELAMAYNGGHANNNNHFQLAMSCAATGAGVANQDAFIASSGKNTLNPVRGNKLASTPDKVTCGNNCGTAAQVLTFVMPAPVQGQQFCTVSMLDQRDWGACFDFQVLDGSRAPTAAPPPPVQIGGSFSGTFPLNSESCTADSPNCCCQTGSLTIQHSYPSVTANAKITLNADGCALIDSGAEASFLLTQITGLTAMRGVVNSRVAGDAAENLQVSAYFTDGEISVNVINLAETPNYCGADMKMSAKGNGPSGGPSDDLSSAATLSCVVSTVAAALAALF